MNSPVNRLDLLLVNLQPKLHDGVYAFASISANFDIVALTPIATFHESEGLTVILEESIAVEAQLKNLFRAAWITLEIQSDLAAVGLTAAVATALARENIACNVIAAAFHDHLFVPHEQGHRALEVLEELATQSRA